MGGKIYVITGGPGSGKSTFIDALKKKGIFCIDEFSIELIKKSSEGVKNVPSRDRKEFEETVLKKRINAFLNAPEEEICFADSGIPDIIVYSSCKGAVPDKYYSAAERYRYQKKVFFLPSWRKIFRKTPEMKETFEESVSIGNKMKKIYKDMGYDVVTVPKLSVEERIDFILSKINQ